MIMVRTSIVFALLLTALAPSRSGAAVFWDSSFEDSEGGLRNSGWITDSCNFMLGTVGSPWPEGCNPTRSTDTAFDGSKSLKKDYNGPYLSADNNRGVYITRSFPPSPEVWTRFWMKNVNYQYSTSASRIDKVHYIYPPQTGENQGASFILNFFYGNKLGIGSQSDSSTAAPCNGGQGGATPGWYNSCNYTENTGSYSVQQNFWFCVEEHVKANSMVNGVAQFDGVLELFITPAGGSTIKTVGYYDRRWTGAGQVYQPNLGLIRIYTQTGIGLQYIDKFAVGNQRIGCTGTPPVEPPPPPPPSTLPAAPTQLNVAELLKMIDGLSRALLTAWNQVIADAADAIGIAWAWIEPVAAFAETAFADRVTISWTNAEKLEPGTRIEIRLSGFWLTAEQQDQVIATIAPEPSALIYKTEQAALSSASDRWLCAKARYKTAGGLYGDYGQPSCNQLAKLITIPEPPAPPADPTPQQRMTITSSETTIVDTKLKIVIDRDKCPNGGTNTSKTFDADGKVVSATDPTWKTREVYVSCK